MHLQVDGDTSTNDAVIALASGLSGSDTISSLNSPEAEHLQLCLDAVSTSDSLTSLPLIVLSSGYSPLLNSIISFYQKTSIYNLVV